MARRRIPKRWLALALLVCAAAILYPLLAAAALARWQPRSVAVVLLAIAGITLLLRRRLEQRSALALVGESAAGLVLIGAALVGNAAAPLLWFPALVNLHLALACGRTLASERPMIERMAVEIQPYLPPFTHDYCQRVTLLWTLFFAANAAGIAALAVASPERWWPLYTSRLYFALVAGISAVEFLVRKLWFRHYGRSPLDRLLAAVFPAENTARGRRSTAYLDEMRRLGLKTD